MNAVSTATATAAAKGRAAKASAPLFSLDAYNVAAAAAVKACNAVDRAASLSAPLVSEWAKAAAIGIMNKALTLDVIKASLITATPLATRKANVAASGRNIDVAALEACGSTIKGHFYSFQRIAADDASIKRLVDGDAFTTVARDTRAVQKQQRNGKAANDDTPKANTRGKSIADKETSAVPSVAIGTLAAAMNELANRIAATSAKVLADKETDAAMAKLVSTIATATAMVERAKAVAKADKAKPHTKGETASARKARLTNPLAA